MVIPAAVLIAKLVVLGEMSGHLRAAITGYGERFTGKRGKAPRWYAERILEAENLKPRSA